MLVIIDKYSLEDQMSWSMLPGCQVFNLWLRGWGGWGGGEIYPLLHYKKICSTKLSHFLLSSVVITALDLIASQVVCVPYIIETSPHSNKISISYSDLSLLATDNTIK